MRIRGFILGVSLLALVGWCMVFESIKQTRARYTLAEIDRRETELKQRLEKLKAREESLLQPARLSILARELKLDAASLGVVPPPESELGGKAVLRRPGDFFHSGGERTLQMASANR